jgi:cation/acetate symporter
MTTFLGFGAATLLGKANIGIQLTGQRAEEFILKNPEKAAVLQKQFADNGFIVPSPNSNLAAPMLAQHLGGDIFLSIITIIAFTTILAVVAGLTIAASSAFAHDIWLMVVKRGKESESEQVLVARVTAAVVGVLSILLAIGFKTLNVAFLVGLAFAVAASANVPALVLSLFWRRMNTTGTIVGMLTGLISSIVLIAVSPAVMGVDAATVATKHLIQAKALFPLDNPAIISVPLGFIAAYLGSLYSKDPVAEAAFPESFVRGNTGLGAEAEVKV